MQRSEKWAISSVLLLCITAITLVYLLNRQRWNPLASKHTEHGPDTSIPAAPKTAYPSATFQKLHAKIYQGESPESYRSNFMSGRRDISRYGNKLPMLFWGQVVDLEGKPVEGAICTFQWRYVPPSEKHFDVIKYSDANGMFEITEAKSTLLNLRVEAPNHWGLSNSVLMLNYAGRPNQHQPIYVPDLQMPHKIVLVKKPVVPHQTVKWLFIEVPADGKEVRFDLDNWKYSKNGQLGLTLPQTFRQSPTDEFKLMGTLEITDGGFVETTDPAPFWPPSEGYTPRIMVRNLENGPLTSTAAYFSYRSAQGPFKYGFMKASISTLGVRNATTNLPFGTVNLAIWLNDDGDRQLAFNPMLGPDANAKGFTHPDALSRGR